MQALFAISVLLLLSALCLYHRFYLMDGNVAKLEARLKEEERHRLVLLHPRTYLDMLFWSERIMNQLHRVKTYQDLCVCQNLLLSFKKYYRDMPEARHQWEAIECVLEIKRSTVRRQERLWPVDVRYGNE